MGGCAPDTPRVRLPILIQLRHRNHLHHHACAWLELQLENEAEGNLQGDPCCSRLSKAAPWYPPRVGFSQPAQDVRFELASLGGGRRLVGHQSLYESGHERQAMGELKTLTQLGWVDLADGHTPPVQALRRSSRTW